MPRATTRNKQSQSQPQQPSQTQGRGNQSHKRKGRVEEADEDEVEDEEQDEDEEMEDADEEGNSAERKANDLVRLALFTEYRRTVLKRDEIAKKVLGGRATKGEFQPVFDRAQQILRKTFSMELHEIMSRAERDKADAAREGAKPVDGENNVTGLKKRSTAASSKQYILRSTLDPILIEAASLCDADIMTAERAENALWYPDDDDRRPEGTLIAWKRASDDQLGAAGVLHVILALILVNGRMLTDMQLRTYLKRLRLPMGSALPSSTAIHAVKPLTIDTYLAQLLKQSYLDKQKTSLASTQGGGGQKRPRGGANQAGGDDGDSSFEWKWGTRAIAEIGEEGVGALVADFMDGIERERERRRVGEDGGGGASGKKERERLEKRKEKLVTAIGRAAGGGLVRYA